MKVLIVCLYYKESAPVFSLGLSEGFKNNNIETFAVVSSDATNINDWHSSFDDNHIYFFDGMPDKRRPFSFVRELQHISSKFRHIQFDYVMLTFPSKSDLLISRVVTKKHIIMFLHDVIPHSSTKDKITKKLKKTINKAEYIIILSKMYANTVKYEYGFDDNNIFVIRHGMPNYPTSGGNIYQQNGNTHYLFFGRIDGYKGLHTLADAYRHLSKKYENITLTIAGNGDFEPYQADYKGLPNADLQIRYIDDVEIAGLFSAEKTVVVLPYLDASQSGVIPMAFYYGVPVIATDVGGIKEQLFDGKVGVLCRPNEPIELAEAMEMFINNDIFYDEQRICMKQYAEKLTWTNVVKDLLSQFASKGL